jgi:hypothetical protein
MLDWRVSKHLQQQCNPHWSGLSTSSPNDGVSQKGKHLKDPMHTNKRHKFSRETEKEE